jgi:ABC-type uncharacterized transport system substrate-binding protein
MKKHFDDIKRVLYLILLVLTLILGAIAGNAQDSIQVKITKIVVHDGVAHVWMRGIKRERDVSYYTACKCKVPYKETDIVWIEKSLFTKTQL